MRSPAKLLTLCRNSEVGMLLLSKVFKFVEGWVEIAGVENSGLCVLEGGFVGCWVSVRIGSC